MKRVAVMLLIATIVAGAVTGHAASLEVRSDDLGSGLAPVASCDTDGVTGSYTSSLEVITAVVVSGIADGSSVLGSGACDGRSVHVEVLTVGGNVVASGSAIITADANATNDTRSVSLDAPPLAAVVDDTRITIT